MFNWENNFLLGRKIWERFYKMSAKELGIIFRFEGAGTDEMGIRDLIEGDSTIY